MALSGAGRLVASSVQDLLPLPVFWDDRVPRREGRRARSRANGRRSTWNVRRSDSSRGSFGFRRVGSRLARFRGNRMASIVCRNGVAREGPFRRTGLFGRSPWSGREFAPGSACSGWEARRDSVPGASSISAPGLGLLRRVSRSAVGPIPNGRVVAHRGRWARSRGSGRMGYGKVHATYTRPGTFARAGAVSGRLFRAERETRVGSEDWTHGFEQCVAADNRPQSSSCARPRVAVAAERKRSASL